MNRTRNKIRKFKKLKKIKIKDFINLKFLKLNLN